MPADNRVAYERMLQASLCFFSQELLGVEIGPHLLAWEDLVLNHDRVAINAARDHSKSTFFSYCYPLWRAWSDPGCEVYIFSKTLEQSKEFLDIIMHGRNNLKSIADIPMLEKLVPASTTGRYRVKQTDLRLTNGSRIRAIGYGKAIRGAHPKYIILDDPLNDEDMYSEMVRKKNIEYYKSAIVNMIMPGGQICDVGTPYHISDLWGWLRKNERYVFRRYPGIVKDDEGKERALFPWRYTLQDLLDKKKEIGTVSFAREILCEPITDDLAIFPSFLFPPLYDDHLTINPKRADIKAKGLTVFMGVDIARSANVGADYFVIFSVGVDDNGNYYILNIERWRGLAFNEQIGAIKRTAVRYGADLIFIEANAMQQVWTDEVIRTTDLPVRPFQVLATNKYPLDKGVPGLRILLENRKIVIPRGDAHSIQVTDTWIEEMTQFGFIDGKLQGIGEHDDTVMAMWMCTEAAKQGGFSFSLGDEDEQSDAELDDEMTGGKGGWEEEFLGKDEDFKDEVDAFAT